MQRIIITALSALLLFAAPACTDGPTAPSATGNLAIGVAELTLSSVDKACYTLIVRNGDDEIVWEQEEICSDQYGDGISAISYVGACDADPDVNENTVEVIITGLESGGADVIADYQNPCPPENAYANTGAPNSACMQTKTCIENRDVLVEFNFTVMSRAKQGFFDIVVEFDEIFCSAKLDTCYEGENACYQYSLVADPAFDIDIVYVWWDSDAGVWALGHECWTDGTPLDNTTVTSPQTDPEGPDTPLFLEEPGNPSTQLTLYQTGAINYQSSGDGSGADSWIRFLWGYEDAAAAAADASQLRGITAILAMACTAGLGKNTELFMNDIVIECDDGTGWDIKHTFSTAGLLPSPDPAALGNQYNPPGHFESHEPWQWGAYYQEEELECDGTPCGKKAFEVAIGIEGFSGENCRIRTLGGAYDADAYNFPNLPDSYPVISWEVPITTADGDLICTSQPLHDEGVVTTTYEEDPPGGGGYFDVIPEPVLWPPVTGRTSGIKGAELQLTGDGTNNQGNAYLWVDPISPHFTKLNVTCQGSPGNGDYSYSLHGPFTAPAGAQPGAALATSPTGSGTVNLSHTFANNPPPPGAYYLVMFSGAINNVTCGYSLATP